MRYWYMIWMGDIERAVELAGCYIVREEDKPSLETKTSGEQRERKKCQRLGKQRRNGEIASR